MLVFFLNLMGENEAECVNNQVSRQRPKRQVGLLSHDFVYVSFGLFLCSVLTYISVAPPAKCPQLFPNSFINYCMDSLRFIVSTLVGFFRPERIIRSSCPDVSCLLLKIPVAFTWCYQMSSYHKTPSTHLSAGFNKTLFFLNESYSNTSEYFSKVHSG